MTNNIFRIFNPNAPKEDPGEKRKGQLRRAQRSYRDRKDKYTKSLEEEVQRAAYREARLVREMEGLRGHVEELTGILSQYGIPIPSQLAGDTGGEVVHGSAPEAHRALPWNQTGSPALASLPGDGGSGSATVMDSAIARASPDDKYIAAPTNQPPLVGTSKKAAEVHSDSHLLQDLDLVAMAMEFVLTLERPCLGHLHGDPKQPHDPTGHVLTTSAQLHFASYGPVSTPPEAIVAPSYEHTPADILDRMLDLASDVCSEGEVTPVQAWHYVRSRPYFGGVDMSSLRRLAERLRELVRCHGFGAVVEFARLETVVYETLIVGQLF